METIQPRFEIKLNTQVADTDLMCPEIDENKLFLSQFDGEEKVVYLTLNGLQITMPIDELKLAVDMLHQTISRYTCTVQADRKCEVRRL